MAGTKLSLQLRTIYEKARKIKNREMAISFFSAPFCKIIGTGLESRKSVRLFYRVSSGPSLTDGGVFFFGWLLMFDFCF